MTIDHLPRARHAMAVLAAGAFFSVACSETNRATIVDNPVPLIEAALVVSDSAPPVGASLTVSMQTTTTQGVIGSYTARITYDATALRYESEVAMGDKSLRASNPSPGLLRFAGAAAAGFPDGKLASYRFVVLQLNGVRSLALAVDEMHMITRIDGKTALTLARMRTAR